jgi:cytochrome c biogenesis protein CcmG, thiol:disulfide interchange protein DsbE
MRQLRYVVLTIAVLAIVAVGLRQASSSTRLGDGTDFDLRGAEKELTTAEAPLDGLYAQANALIGGGEPAFRQQLSALQGTPIVLNKWASWCPPCQAEFPVFQAATVMHGKEIAFVGLNAHDQDAAARRFLDSRPLPFPSYTDPDDRIARQRGIGVGFPLTQFIGRDGATVFVHTGPYTSREQLTQDIERYLR